MAGLSKRFLDAGFDIPKYMLTAHEKTLFHWAIISFKKYFEDQNFLFICRDVYGTKSFIENSANQLGILKFKVIELKSKTLGQAHTVQLGLHEACVSDDEPLVIFNIDTFRFGYEFPKFVNDPKVSGYLECFIGEGYNWSNVVTEYDNSCRVIRTSEKLNESNLCSTGLYYFASTSSFLKSYHSYYTLKEHGNTTEHFIAPIYNKLIELGNNVKVDVIPRSSVIFCGTPNEYYEFKSTPLSN